MISRQAAGDLLAENYGACWKQDDPDWWEGMTGMLQEYGSVRALRRHQPGLWRIPSWWPGQPGRESPAGS